MRAVRFYICTMALAFYLSGCSLFGGEIIKVTVVPENASGLKFADRDKLQQLKSSADSSAAAGINSIVTGPSRTVSVAEYLQLFPNAGAGEYTVGANDLLNIIVYNENELSYPAVRVSTDGFISYPFLGRLKVGGLTVAQIEQLIVKKLAEGRYLLNADVAVLITEYASKLFVVLGAVEKPGEYSLAANERILNAISKASGILQAQRGSSRSAKLVRTIYPGTPRQEQLVIDVNLSSILQGANRKENLFLMDKDTLFVPMPENFYILGEVKNPGAYPLAESDISIIEGIGIAGGFTKIAARNSTKIIRSENGQEKIIEVRVDAITDTGRQLRDIILQPDDIIIVPESFF